MEIERSKTLEGLASVALGIATMITVRPELHNKMITTLALSYMATFGFVLIYMYLGMSEETAINVGIKILIFWAITCLVLYYFGEIVYIGIHMFDSWK